MWNVKTAEIWGDRYQYATFSDDSLQQVSDKKTSQVADSTIDMKFIDAGSWKPFDGLKMTDVLFPHISHGFRNEIFHIITYHVRFLILMKRRII